MRGAIVTAGLGVVLILTAAVFDAEPLYVPGVAFAALAAGAAGWVIAGAHGVRITRTVAVRRALEEEPVALTVVVQAGRAGLPAGVVEDDLLPVPAPLAGGRRPTRLVIQARFARRGRKLLAPPRVVVRDPFGMAARTVTAPAVDELLVLPRTEPVRTPGSGGGGNGAPARRGRPTPAAEVDFDGLRPHREGSPASRIYWPALARGGELVERRLRADGDTRPLVVLDPRGAASAEDLDAAVRAAASLCVHHGRRRGCALLLPGDRRPTALDTSLAGWTALHVRLALLGGDAGPPLAGLAARRGPVFFVAARRDARPPQALLHAPGAERVLVVPGALPGRAPVLEVAGCSGYDVGAERQSSERRRRRGMRETAA
ncbi:MAG TPA: DUF58 domain-containing protein [Solirubrobacteraceae bacterium]|nr:DUF58 domain-containing protein [Solirubrobacteraceae bacterium]